ncbi:MAG: radical SAM protein [Clostridia bacterium]|nr:radical SAM protein [Clostridia bacterium]
MKATEKLLTSVIDKLIQCKQEERIKKIEDLIDFTQKFSIKTIPPERFDAIKAALGDPQNRWIRLLNSVIDETDPFVLRKTLLNFGYHAYVQGTKKVRKNREKYRCNIPWLILFDPTSACNMHCDGCWAGTYGDRNNLSLSDMDSIVSQGKKLGVYLYLLTGGEPLVRKDDILRLAEMHNDAQFAVFTNSTLIDETFCEEVRKRGNILFMLSVEGTPGTNDARRGKGHFHAVTRAMALLRSYGILFGVSVCYTRQNIKAVTSDDFLSFLAQSGARFGFYFHYMPIGTKANTELLPTPEQRKYMIERIRWIRSDECDLPFFPMDFQNDGEYVGGCIAGGRNYFHINAVGDAEPCVFIHYSDKNIHTSTLLEILQAPLFMAYYQNQPFNDNHLRPCPMLENPEILRKLIKSTHAENTDLSEKEDVDKLCEKCGNYAKEWTPEADVLWKSQTHITPRYRNYQNE